MDYGNMYDGIERTLEWLVEWLLIESYDTYSGCWR